MKWKKKEKEKNKNKGSRRRRRWKKKEIWGTENLMLLTINQSSKTLYGMLAIILCWWHYISTIAYIKTWAWSICTHTQKKKKKKKHNAAKAAAQRVFKKRGRAKWYQSIWVPEVYDESQLCLTVHWHPKITRFQELEDKVQRRLLHPT